MSKCVVHMMKLKMSAVGGIQSHNQREHESRKNHEIDYEKSRLNADTVVGENINYREEIQGRIAQLNLPKAVRKDAVVYCSMLVSSDSNFFEILCEKEHYKRESQLRESVAIGLEPPTPFEYMPQDYQEECYQSGAMTYFEKATSFFQDRYGIENVVNGSVHFDEATPHMHLGIVPVTSDGRLSAKNLFTRLELKQLQTDFANVVGSKFDLERGLEGSKARHIDELTFKAQKRQEALEQVTEQVQNLETREYLLRSDCTSLEQQKQNLSEQVQSLSKSVTDLQGEVNALDTQKRLMERLIAQLQDYKERVERAIEKLSNKFLNQADLKNEIQRERAMDYIEKTGQMSKFDDFCNSPAKGKVKTKTKSTREI